LSVQADNRHQLKRIAFGVSVAHRMIHFEIFPWNNNFATGIEKIDSQHKELVKLLNLLVEHIAYESEAPVLEQVFKQISDYVTFHFAEEEEIWHQHFAGDSWLKWHQQSHIDFASEIQKIQQLDSVKSFEVSLLEIVKFLTHWLARHILDSDRRMAKVVLALPSGISLAMAKEAADAEMTGASRVLIDTLMTMYDRLADSTVRMSREIQMRKKAEEELIRAKAALEIDSRAKSTFIANLSHELRSPLNTILGYSELLHRDTAIPDHARDMLAVMRKSGDHLLTVINEVLEIAKIEAGHIHLEERAVDAVATVREVVEMFELPATTKGLGLHFESSTAGQRFFVTDVAKFKQILINLLSNALFATSTGTVRVRLEFSAPENGDVRVFVDDTGTGVAPEDQERIFLPFEQVQSAGKSRGSGLGLAISRQFAALLGGQIFLQSELGKGSTFCVELPAVSPPPDDFIYLQNSGEGQVRLVQQKEQIRLLVVDDQQEDAAMLARLLESTGFAVRIAENGLQAVQLASQWSPHLIWMDQRMPGMGGVEACRAIRSNPQNKGIRIVALTASSVQDGPDRIGADDFDLILHKPYRHQQIFDCLERLLGIRFTRSQALEKRPSNAASLQHEISSVPPHLLHALEQAIATLQQDLMLECVEQFGAISPALVAELRQLIAEYDYERLMSMLREARP